MPAPADPVAGVATDLPGDLPRADLPADLPGDLPPADLPGDLPGESAGASEPDLPDGDAGGTAEPAGRGKRRHAAHAPPKSRRTRIIEWASIVVIAVVVALLVRAFLLQAFYIPSGSMEPTLGINNRVVVFKLAYDFGSVQPGDIVVFRTPPADREDPGIKDLVKRVVGLPGQTISSAPDGHVLINGKPLDESYLPAKLRTGRASGNLAGAGPGICAAGGITCTASGTYTIPKGQVFVMGDNRGDSYDSRFFGTISTSLIVGQVVMKVWPLNQITFY
ncbi:MAG: signal peptidase I [Acidimicrobiales bacterium]